MDVKEKIAKAKRMGEVAAEIEALELSLTHAQFAQKNRAWAVKIIAVDEAECERSIDFNLPPHSQFIADLRSPGEHGRIKAQREQAIADSARIFALVEQMIADKLAARQAEMDSL